MLTSINLLFANAFPNESIGPLPIPSITYSFPLYLITAFTLVVSDTSLSISDIEILIKLKGYCKVKYCSLNASIISFG